MCLHKRRLSWRVLRMPFLVAFVVVEMLQPSHRGAASPIEDYREVRYLNAIRGLTFDNGIVELAADWQQVLAVRASGEDVQTILQRAADRLEHNMTIEALEDYTTAVLVDPMVPAAYQGMGRALIAESQPGKAIPAFRTALRLDPNLIETRYALASAHWMQANVQEAIETWRQLLTIDANHAETHERLAIALYYLGDYQQSWRHVHAAQVLGHQVPPQFRALLESRMLEPE